MSVTEKWMESGERIEDFMKQMIHEAKLNQVQGDIMMAMFHLAIDVGIDVGEKSALSNFTKSLPPMKIVGQLS